MEKMIPSPYSDHIDISDSVLLLIDDNEELLELLSDEIGDKYIVLTATSAELGLQVLEGELVDLVICDVMMDGMDGYEFCQLIKSYHAYAHIPVILLTAKDNIQDKVNGLTHGADVYIEKPYITEFILAQVASLIRNRAKTRQYFSSAPLLKAETKKRSYKDQLLLNKINELIIDNLGNKELSVEDLANHMNMSKATLYRKIKLISDLSPKELINIVRLKMAITLLAKGDLKMYEIAEAIGYSSQSYFTRSFLRHFGLLPSEYQGLKSSSAEI